MTEHQIWFFYSLGGFLLVGIIWLVRVQSFREKYSLLWIATCLLFITIPMFYDLYIWVGNLAGIITPVSFFFFSALLMLFLLSIQFTVALTVAFNQRKNIAQHVALLEGKFKELEKRLAIKKVSD